MDGRDVVFDGTYVMKCFKCQGYNRKSSECKNESVYFKCHGNRVSKECNKENKRLNLGLDEYHVTNSREYPVYQNKLNLKK